MAADALFADDDEEVKPKKGELTGVIRGDTRPVDDFEGLSMVMIHYSLQPQDVQNSLPEGG